MGFLNLFLVASFPVIKVLLITALGLFLALDGVSILGNDARKIVNQLGFYVFFPSLVGSNLAKSITFDSVVKLWFMPVNILATFILGSALGWILIKITRPPKYMEGLILGCCSAGNLGNLPMIIIPAICKEKDSPFGEPDLCYQYGMSYAVLSMAIGAVFLWGYVYNIMRICSSRIQKEDTTSNDILKAPREISESDPNNLSETLIPTEDTMDDTYTILLSDEEPEKKISRLNLLFGQENLPNLLSINHVSFPSKIKHHLREISSNLNLKSIFAPSTIGAIVGFFIGVIPQIRNFTIGNNAPLRVVEDSATMLGDAAIPTMTLIMGGNLLKGLKGSSPPVWSIVGIVVVRYILLPLLGMGVVKAAIHLSLVHSDSLYQFVLLLQYALPPAMNIGTIAQLFGSGESECSVIMLWTYGLASIAVTLWSTYFMFIVS